MHSKKTGFFLTAILGLIILLPLTAGARSAFPILDNWVNENNFTTKQLNAVADNGAGTMYVAVGNSGTFLSSVDANYWKATSITGFTKNLLGVAFAPGIGTGTAGGRFVAVGDTKTIYYSDDGVTWLSSVTSNLAGNFKAVTYGNGIFVVVGDSGRIYNSTDGILWTQPQPKFITGSTLYAVLWVPSEELFIAVGSGSTVMLSQDGALWVKSTISGAGTLQGVAFGISPNEKTGKFVAVNSSGSVLISYDGLVSWAILKPANTGMISTNLHGITYSDGMFTTVGDKGLIYTSTDAFGWQLAGVPEKNTSTTPINTNIRAVGNYNGSVFYAVGDSGMILSNTDTSRFFYKSGTSGNLVGAAYGNGTFVIGGQYGDLFVSPDGTNWSESRFTAFGSTNPHVQDITYGNGLFVAVTAEDWNSTIPSIFTSPDGLTWTQQGFPTNYATVQYQDLLGVAYGQGLTIPAGIYVAVGTGGTIVTSPDAISDWTPTASNTSYHIYSVAFGSDMFAAVGTKTILTSTNGTTWTNLNINTFPNFESVAYGNGSFVAVASSGAIYTNTPPSTTWIKQTTVGAALHAVQYGESSDFTGYVAVGSGGALYVSADGVNWSKQKSGTGNTLYGITFGETGAGTSVFVAAGSSSALMKSPALTD